MASDCEKTRAARISARCARAAPLTRDRPRTRAPFRRAPSAQHHGAMRSDVDGPRFVAALQHLLDCRGERFRSDCAGEPLNPCEADAALSCRERLGPEHAEGPLFGLTVVHDALPRLRVPCENVEVSQSPRWLLDPRAVQCPVAPAGRDIEPWRSCLDALVPVPGLARRGLLDLDSGPPRRARDPTAPSHTRSSREASKRDPAALRQDTRRSRRGGCCSSRAGRSVRTPWPAFVPARNCSSWLVTGKDSDVDALDLVERDLFGQAIIELRGAGGHVPAISRSPPFRRYSVIPVPRKP